MGRSVECTHSSGSPLLRRQTQLHRQNEKAKKKKKRKKEVKIFEQSIQTPCGLYRRQTASEQLSRMGDEDMAKMHREFFFLSWSWAAKMALIY